MTYLKREAKKLKKNKVRLRFIGQRERFSSKLQALMTEVEEMTMEGAERTLVLATDYGGRWDIAQAARKMAEKVAAGELRPDEINENTLHQHISLADLPPPDLLIRTGGEYRISNFLLWQSAYTEFYFTETYWPDFDESALDLAIESFHQRQRRFGKTGDQVKEEVQRA